MQHGNATDPYRIFFRNHSRRRGRCDLAALLLRRHTGIFGTRTRVCSDGRLSLRVYLRLPADGDSTLHRDRTPFTAGTVSARRDRHLLRRGFRVPVLHRRKTTFVVAHLFLLGLIISRFRRRRLDPPDTLPLIGLGLLSGTLAALINAGIAWNIIGRFWDPLGKRLMTEGMVLLLVLGIGGFVGPRLLGFAQLPQFNKLKPANRERPGRKAHLYTLGGLLIMLSLIAEYGFGISVMAFVRAAPQALSFCQHCSRGGSLPCAQHCPGVCGARTGLSFWQSGLWHSFPGIASTSCTSTYRRVHAVDSCGRNACNALAWGPRPRNRKAIMAAANRCQYWTCRDVGPYRGAVCWLHLLRASRLGGDFVDHRNARMGTPRHQAHPEPSGTSIARLTAGST
jgi:hypothetical protein